MRGSRGPARLARENDAWRYFDGATHRQVTARRLQLALNAIAVIGHTGQHRKAERRRNREVRELIQPANTWPG
jgi:hypothetical protein